MQFATRILPCLWFDRQAEAAARFYTSVFPDGKITSVTRYPDAGQEIHGGEAGAVLVVAFELAGVAFTALNGGPAFRFNEAVSLQVMCDTQEEVDRYWELLGEGGDPAARQCGWLKDRYGLSWQVIPAAMLDLYNDPDPAKAARAFAAMLKMKKLDLAAVQRAHRGQ